MSTGGRLTKVYGQAQRICFTRGNRFIIMSDCHRGVGNLGDNFLKNRPVYLAALQYYYQRGFTYLELGDGDELWENKTMEPIVKMHAEAFELLSAFYREGRLYMLYGNHDLQKRKKGFCKEQCSSFLCRISGKEKELFPGLTVQEGLVLEECDTGRQIFLVHGHQGDLWNDTFFRVNRFLVRHVWRHLELLGMENPISAAGSGKKKTKVERRLAEWAKVNQKLTVAGHTHRPSFQREKGNYYLNDGSCVHPFSITGIEVENGKLRLVEWSVMTRADNSMYIGRKVLEEGNLNFYEE